MSYEKKLISYQDGKVLFDEYSKTNHKTLAHSRTGEPDSRWYWFSLEELEGYIEYVKKNAEKQKLENLGIRIYLGKYPIDYPANKMAKPEYAGYQTIFLVPTSQEASKSDAMRIASEEANAEEIPADVQTIQSMNLTNLAPPPKVPGVGTMH